MDRKDRVQFEQLFVPHLTRAYNLARWLVRHQQDAEDLVQEAYLKAYKSFDQYRGGDPKSWLFAIVRNTCLTWLKRNNKNRKVIDFNEALVQHSELPYPTHVQLAQQPEPDAELIAETEKDHVHNALRQLPEPYRVILVLREFEDLSYRQISEILGLPIGTVMSRLSRARVQIKELLSK